MPEMSRSPATRWNLQDLAVSWNFMKIQWWPSECKALLKGIKHQNLYKARAHVDPLPLGLHVETWYGARSIHVEYVESLGVWTFSPPPEHVWPEELSQKALAAIGWEDPRLQDGGVAEGASEGARGGSLYWFTLPKPTSWNLNCRIFLRRWANFANLCLIQTCSNKVADQQLENMMPPFWTEKPKETKNFSPRRPQSRVNQQDFADWALTPGSSVKGCDRFKMSYDLVALLLNSNKR